VLARGQGLDLGVENTSFYLGREKLTTTNNSKMAQWRVIIFIFMSRNAADAGPFFNLPAKKVIET
jgi:KUP system potassium uptake protein